MKVNELKYTVTLTQSEVDSICKALKYMRLSKELKENPDSDFVHDSINILEGFKNIASIPSEALEELNQAYQKEVDELLG